MIITRNWINNFMDLSGIENEDISIALNSLGFEVEETKNYAKLNKGLVIGYVAESKKIPDTHLTVNKVEIADKKKTVQIVCGAPNIKEHQYVIVAPVGAQLANGLKISERDVHGFKSQGMICALEEIGINENVLTDVEKSGIFQVNSLVNLSQRIGDNLDVIGFNDFAWDISLTLNRSDALAAVQILKELGNYFKKEIDYYRLDNDIKNVKNRSLIALDLKDDVQDVVNTAAYSTFIIQNNEENMLTAKDDLWLKYNDVKTTGNFVYDLANKTAIEMGQPVILIDYDKIKTERITVTKQVIDDNELIVLKDGSSLIDILGQEVESKYQVDSQTTRMLALFFNFDPAFMRKQQKAINSNTVAIQRYIKPEYANKFDNANEAMKDILDDYALIDTAFKLEYVKGPVAIHNEFDTTLNYINSTLGTDLDEGQLKNIFAFLDFELKFKGNDVTFIVDPNRIDIYGEKDICEEVARLYGYDNIPVIPLVIEANQTINNLKEDLENKVMEYFIGKGFNNVKTYSLVSNEINNKWNLFNLTKPIKLMSPLSKLHEVCRFSLSKSLIDTVIYNAANSNKDTSLFEFSNVYFNNGEHERHLAFSLSGEFYQDFRQPKDLKADFFFAKGLIEDIFDLYNIDPMKISFENQNNLNDDIHPYINAKIKINNKIVGFVYKLNPLFEDKNKIKNTFVCELNVDVLFEQTNQTITNKEISKYQNSTRDISLEIENGINYQEIIKGLLNEVDNVTNYKVIDLYQDNEMKQNNKTSLAISFTFNNVEHQLTDKEIDENWTVLLNNAKKLGLKVR